MLETLVNQGRSQVLQLVRVLHSVLPVCDAHVVEHLYYNVLAILAVAMVFSHVLIASWNVLKGSIVVLSATWISRMRGCD